MKVWLITEAYYPDEAGTAYTFTSLAEYLAKHFDVNVLCGLPRYTARGLVLQKKERRKGVNIHRSAGTTYNKDRLFLRFINLLTISVSIFFNAIFRFQKNDIALVVTSPPSLPFIIALVCYFRKVKCLLRVDDAFPENLVATNIIKKDSFIFYLLSKLTKLLYNNVDKIIVLGRDQKILVSHYLHNLKAKNVNIISNWSDTSDIKPEKKISNKILNDLYLNDKFIIQIAGNMGKGQAIESVFKCVEILKYNNNIHFLFIGAGSKLSWMQEEIKQKKLDNVSLLKQRPRRDQNNFLNACDVALISLLPTMAGIGVPSRIYNVLASGKPIIGVVPSDSELSLIIKEENIGWVVSPEDPERLAKIVLEAYSKPDVLQKMGLQARSISESKYDHDTIMNKYRLLFNLLNNSKC